MATPVLLIVISLILGAAAWLLFLWAVKSDQYDDVERPKHRMLDDGEENRKPAERRGTPDGQARRKEGDPP